MLKQAGITTAEELRTVGADVAYQRVCQMSPGGHVSKNLPYAIHGALANRDWVEVARIMNM